MSLFLLFVLYFAYDFKFKQNTQEHNSVCYVSGRFVVVGELSFEVSGVQRRPGGVHGPRRHGRLDDRRTDFKLDCQVSGLEAAALNRLITPAASDDVIVEFPSSLSRPPCCSRRCRTLCRCPSRFCSSSKQPGCKTWDMLLSYFDAA